MIIYKIKNKINGKVYIGKHCGDTDSRWKTHLRYALDGTRPEHLYRAMNLYGIENFTYEVLESHPISIGDDFLNEREKFHIKKFKSRSDQNGYNMTEGGEGVTAQFCSTETKKKMSDSQSRYDYASYSCSSGKLLKVFKKRDDILKEYPQIRHVRHVNHACNANNPFYTGKKYSSGVHPTGMYMWIKLPKNSNFPEKLEILPGCKQKPRTTKKRKGDNSEIAQYTLSGNLIKVWPNVVTQIATELGTQYSLIGNAIKGKSSSHLNFIWRLFPKGESPQNIEGLRDSKIVTFSKKQITSLPIVKKLDGKEVFIFDSAVEALLITDMKPTELFKCLNDGVEDSNGFSWSWL
jgi:group I intron endonuclease